MKAILVVCEGNICRSPMAAGLLASALPGSMVRSAGLGALVGQPPDPLAVQLMLERGIDIARHRAVQINRPMCIESDIVLVMDSEQRRRLQQLYPEVHGRVFRLGEYLERDVPDPFRQPIAAFRNAFSLIEDSIDHWLGRFRRL